MLELGADDSGLLASSRSAASRYALPGRHVTRAGEAPPARGGSLPRPRRWTTTPAGDSTHTNTERWISVRSAWHAVSGPVSVPRHRPPETFGRSSVRRTTATVCRMTWDVAVIGAGFVGLPLAVRSPTPARGSCGSTRPGEGRADHGGQLLRRRRDRRRARGAGRDELPRRPPTRRRRRRRRVIICVPTPSRRPRARHSFIRSAAASIATRLSPARSSCSSSTTYPGTTSGLLREILETSGLVAGGLVHLAMSPARIDPGRTDFTIRNTSRSSAASRRPAPRRRWRSTGPAATSWCRCRCRRRRASPVAQERLPLDSDVAFHIDDGDHVRPHRHQHPGGDRARPLTKPFRPSRVPSPAPASAATSCSSIPSTLASPRARVPTASPRASRLDGEGQRGACRRSSWPSSRGPGTASGAAYPAPAWSCWASPAEPNIDDVSQSAARSGHGLTEAD